MDKDIKPPAFKRVLHVRKLSKLTQQTSYVFFLFLSEIIKPLRVRTVPSAKIQVRLSCKIRVAKKIVAIGFA